MKKILGLVILVVFVVLAVATKDDDSSPKRTNKSKQFLHQMKTKRNHLILSKRSINLRRIYHLRTQVTIRLR